MADQTTTTSTNEPRDIVADANQPSTPEPPETLRCIECHVDRTGIDLVRHTTQKNTTVVTCRECGSILWSFGRMTEA